MEQFKKNKVEKKCFFDKSIVFDIEAIADRLDITENYLVEIACHEFCNNESLIYKWQGKILVDRLNE